MSKKLLFKNTVIELNKKIHESSDTAIRFFHTIDDDCILFDNKIIITPYWDYDVDNTHKLFKTADDALLYDIKKKMKKIAIMFNYLADKL